MPGAVRIVIDGAPVAKGRPKIGRMASGRPVAFTPAKTRSYESFVRLLGSQAMAGRPPMTGPVAMTLTAVFAVPASWSGKKQALAEAGKIVPTSRPDVDNYVKAAFDALNNVVIRDDSQVVALQANKAYSRKPRLEIEVSPYLLADMAEAA